MQKKVALSIVYLVIGLVVNTLQAQQAHLVRFPPGYFPSDTRQLQPLSLSMNIWLDAEGRRAKVADFGLCCSHPNDLRLTPRPALTDHNNE